ncbi:MAG: DSD1 family PLP-dependent enzyme [Promethearchaeota archaeon]|nr:MAG: DSD1 family PLP-dependent enzyme [Candidatus Lokiarchaeota archaeon]
MGKNWKDEISTPALVLHYDLMQKNIETMAKFAKENNVSLRPHVKTHKCPIIGKKQLEAGANGICVARVGEAEIFAQNGFNDILIANQVIDLSQIKRLVELNKKSLIRVCVDSEKNILDLNQAASKKDVKLEVLIEVDVGLGRNGVKPGEPALHLANFIKKQPNLKLVGLQGYEGHLTSVLDPELREKQTNECMKRLVNTRNILNNNGFNMDYLTASNTVTYKFSAKYDGITELQTGTYIFNDEHYYRVSPEFNIAVTVLGTVTNIPGNRYYTIDAGLKAATNDNGNPIFKNYPKCKIRVMTEEHSIFRASPKDKFEIGQKLELYPSHICTTVNLYDFFTVVKDGKIIAKWDILARGKNY